MSERPTSPSLYDSRPFSLTYSTQAEPIMRMSMSDETNSLYPLNNQTQESGLVRKEAPPPLSPSMENRSLHHDSGFTSTGAHKPTPHHRPSAADIFYSTEDEDLIDPHQKAPPPSLHLDASQSSLHHNDKHTNDDLTNHTSTNTPSRVIQHIHNHDRIDEEDGEEDQPAVDHERTSERVSWQWDSMDYVDWMNRHLDQRKLTHVTDLRTGELLVDLLEAISGKQVRRPATTAKVGGTLTSMQMLDNIVAAFKFMGREGVVVDGRYNIKGNSPLPNPLIHTSFLVIDVFSGNESKLLEMLRTIKDWADQLHPSTEKMASGGTFGEEEQGKLKALDEF